MDLKLQQEFLDPQLSFWKNSESPCFCFANCEKGLAKSSLWQSEEKYDAVFITLESAAFLQVSISHS